MKIMKQDVKIQKLVIEVMKHVRQQTYTPEQLCERQRILDAQYFYYWSMDMKKEEYVCDLFTEDFTYCALPRARQSRRIRQCVRSM